MSTIKAHGLWCLPDEPEKQVVGTLRKNRNGIRVLLTGGFSDAWCVFGPEVYKTVFGIIDKHSAGHFVTLVDCRETRHTVGMPGFATQELLANIAYIGDAHLTDADRKFTGAHVRFAHLDQWYDSSNFTTDFLGEAGVAGMTITYRRPERVEFPVRDKRLRIATSFSSGPGLRLRTLREKPYLVVEDLAETDLQTITQSYVFRLRNFISLATDRPCPISSNSRPVVFPLKTRLF